MEDAVGARLWEATRVLWYSGDLWRLQTRLARPGLHLHSWTPQRSLWGWKYQCNHCIKTFFQHWDLWHCTWGIHGHPFSPLSALGWNGVCSFPSANKWVCLHPCGARTIWRELLAQEASSHYYHTYQGAGLHYGRSGILARKIRRVYEDHSDDEASLSSELGDTFGWRNRRV
jgi:hypothetical protein